MDSRTAASFLFLATALVFAVPAGAQPEDLAEQAATETANDSDADAKEPQHKESAALLSSATGSSVYRPLTGKERWRLYLKNAYWSPMSMGRSAGAALGGQLANDPYQWGQGMEGYGRRLADRSARFAVQESYQALGAALLQHEVRYIPSKKTTFFPRLVYAIAANFVTYDRNGHRTAHVTRLGAVVGAEFTADLWQPEGYSHVSDTMRGVGVQLGTSSAINLLREFGPELKRVFRRR